MMNDKSPTPRTDAADDVTMRFTARHERVRDLARQLERELTASETAMPELARQILDRLECELGSNHAEVLAFAQKLGWRGVSATRELYPAMAKPDDKHSTPRTDAHLAHLNLPDGRKVGIPNETVALLRQLERELAEAYRLAVNPAAALAKLEATPSATPMPARSCWLVENGKDAPRTRYRTIDQGIPVWTADVNKAIRFARREDAEMFAAEDSDAWRIAEHLWQDQPRYVGGGR